MQIGTQTSLIISPSLLNFLLISLRLGSLSDHVRRGLASHSHHTIYCEGRNPWIFRRGKIPLKFSFGPRGGRNFEELGLVWLQIWELGFSFDCG